ncbi:hypothetical protein AGMMS49983_19530 [Clostridia bacterium]|nr:hypothetical protein AGMMS49983_19530 [Clostridia bacterium]
MLHKGGSKINFKIFVPILIAALVVCIVVLISRLEKPAEMTVSEGIAPIIVAEVTPAEPVSSVGQPVIKEPPEGLPPLPKEESAADADIEEPEPEPEEASSGEPVAAPEVRIADGLVAQDKDKLSLRTTELEDMKAMLAILEERNNDSERIALYKGLIAKTEKEISDLEKSIARYQKALEE